MDYSAVTPSAPSQQASQSQQNTQAAKPVPVVSKSDVVVHKASVGKKLYDSFFGATPQEVMTEVKKNVLKPSIKKILLDFVIYGASMMINGTGNQAPIWNPYSPIYSPYTGANVINYNAISKPQQTVVVGQPQAKPTPNGIFTLDAIDFLQYAKALEVKNSMAAHLAAYHLVSVSDYYDFCNVDHDFMTEKWGWDNLDGLDVVAVGDKWRLVLPPVRPIAR